MYTKSLGLTLTLAIALITLGYADPSLAAPKKCVGAEDGTPGCGGSEEEDETLTGTWNLDIDETDYIAGDGATYEDSNKGHVQITGGGGGFRFDTNLQNVAKQSRFSRARWVYMDVDDDDDHNDSVLCEIDFRFDQTDRLDLGSLTEGASGTIPATLRYYCGAPVADHNPLNYGILGFKDLNAPAPTGAAFICLEQTEPIEATRDTDTRWTLESQSSKACRFPLDASGNRCIDDVGADPFCAKVIDFQFKFIITPQP